MNHIGNKHKLVVAAALLLLWLLPGMLFSPAVAHAQSINWQETRTDYFLILYAPGEEQTAQAYAGFVDDIYDELSVSFNFQTATPLTINLYPDFESYYEVNPTARNMPGIVAHADFRRRQLAVVLPQTQQQTPDEIQNNIRHELTHIIAADLSDNRLNTGWQEGIAQYMEIPTAETQRKLDLLAQDVQQGSLLSWSDFEERDNIYGQPERGYPQTFSAVTFLIDTYGFERFQTFLTTLANSSGYRTAIENSYGIPASDLEQQWLAWLPQFVDGTYTVSPMVGYDLGFPRQMVSDGRYTAAQEELERIIPRLQNADEPEMLAEAEQLLATSRAGQEADALASSARTALEAGDYVTARDQTAAAQAAYAAIGDTRNQQVLEVYAARAAQGLAARSNLADASTLLDDFNLFAARDRAAAAAADFANLGDEASSQQALGIAETVNNVQRIGGIMLVAVGVLGLLSGLWMMWQSRKAEVW